MGSRPPAGEIRYHSGGPGLRPLCLRAGEPHQAAPDGIDGWTTVPANVTCPRCLEWMHA